MPETKALAVVFDRSDTWFFTQHRDRQARIRKPYQGESEGEFWSLGQHDRDRRRIILWKIPRDNPYYKPEKPSLLKIPFLAFADETVEDRDDILLPIIHQIMSEAASTHGA